MNTKERILYESISLFAEHGFSDTSLAKVAKIIGIAKPSFYAHYTNKISLFEACLEEIATHQLSVTAYVLNNHKLSTEEKLYKLLENCSTIENKEIFKFYYRFYFFPPKNLIQLINESLVESNSKCDELIKKTISNGVNQNELTTRFTEEEIFNSYKCLMDGFALNNTNFKNLNSTWRVFWNGIKMI